MADIKYNVNPKEDRLPKSYSRRRNNAFLDKFTSIKHIQRTNRLSSSHYIDTKTAHVGSKENTNKKHWSYDGYLRKLKSPIIKSKGNKTGIIKGCKCENEPELTYSPVQTIDITYDGPTYNVNDNVYAIKGLNNYYEQAIIKNIDGLNYDISFNSDDTGKTVSKNELEPYFGECKCGTIKNGKMFISDPSKIGECGAKGKEYFIQMGGYYKQVKCL